MSRPNYNDTINQTEAWDTKLMDNFDTLLARPLPVVQSATLIALTADFPPDQYDNCMAVLANDLGTLYMSDGVDWVVAGTGGSGGGLALLAEAHVTSTTANIDLSWVNPATSNGLLIIVRNLESSASARPQFRGSIDAGSTFKQGVSDYSWYANIINTASVDAADSEIQLTVDSLAIEATQINIHVSFPEEAGDRNTFLADVARNTPNATRREQAGGTLNFDTKMDGFSFFMSTGDIERADIEVYSI